jgi:hypothetical protein
MPPLGSHKLAVWASLISAITGGCSPPRLSLGDHGRILFSTIGTRPFQDYVFSIRPDGSGLRRILKPSATRSYVFASAHSLSGPLVITVNEMISDRAAERLYVYDRGLSGCRPVLPESTPQGTALLSPDGNRAVFCAARAGNPRTVSLWIVDLHTEELREVVVGDGATGLYPAWGSQGKIAFVRAYRSDRGLLTELMEVSDEGGNQKRLLLPEDGVAAATYAPEGRQMAVWTKKGLEILSLANGDRRLAFKWEPSKDGYIFRAGAAGGVAWSATGEIAFSLLSKKTRESELWVVNQDGTNAKRVYSTKDGHVLVGGFLDE